MTDQAAPSTRWYRAGVIAAAVGVLAALAWWPYAAVRVHDAVYAFDRINAGGGSIELDRGTYTLWLEGSCMSCAGNEPREYREVATLEIDPPVEVEAAGRGWVYNTGAREGRGVYVLEVPESGTYGVRFRLDTATIEWDNASPALLAFGPGEGLPVSVVRPMVGLAGGGLALGVAAILVTFVRRRRFYERRYSPESR